MCNRTDQHRQHRNMGLCDRFALSIKCTLVCEKHSLGRRYRTQLVAGGVHGPPAPVINVEFGPRESLLSTTFSTYDNIYISFLLCSQDERKHGEQQCFRERECHSFTFCSQAREHEERQRLREEKKNILPSFVLEPRNMKSANDSEGG